jgi:hypothetical protein
MRVYVRRPIGLSEATAKRVAAPRNAGGNAAFAKSASVFVVVVIPMA